MAGNGRDTLFGKKGHDVLHGEAGSDRIFGGKGDDILVGGSGADVLTGGRGADVFRFEFATDSTSHRKGRDVISDFRRKDGDKIDLSTMQPENDVGAFIYIGDDKFSGIAGELRAVEKKGRTLVRGDLDGDGKADFGVELSGTITLKETDFIL